MLQGLTFVKEHLVRCRLCLYIWEPTRTHTRTHTPLHTHNRPLFFGNNCNVENGHGILIFNAETWSWEMSSPSVVYIKQHLSDIIILIKHWHQTAAATSLKLLNWHQPTCPPSSEQCLWVRPRCFQFTNKKKRDNKLAQPRGVCLQMHRIPAFCNVQQRQRHSNSLRHKNTKEECSLI